MSWVTEEKGLRGGRYLQVLTGSKRMLQGKVIINFQYDEKNEKCSWDMKQEGKDKLDSENLILLFQHCIGELMDNES